MALIPLCVGLQFLAIKSRDLIGSFRVLAFWAFLARARPLRVGWDWWGTFLLCRSRSSSHRACWVKDSKSTKYQLVQLHKVQSQVLNCVAPSYLYLLLAENYNCPLNRIAQSFALPPWISSTSESYIFLALMQKVDANKRAVLKEDCSLPSPKASTSEKKNQTAERKSAQLDPNVSHVMLNRGPTQPIRT